MTGTSCLHLLGFARGASLFTQQLLRLLIRDARLKLKLHLHREVGRRSVT